MEETKMDTNIYGDKEKIVQRAINKISQDTAISQRNKDLILKFSDYLYSNGCQHKRVAKVSMQIYQIAKVIDKDFDKLKIDDITAFLSLQASGQWRNLKKKPLTAETQHDLKKPLTAETQHDYKRAIKQFYYWFYDMDEQLESSDLRLVTERKKFYEYIRKRIKKTYKLKKVEYSEVLQEQDIKTVLQKGCISLRDKAFISMLHETGCRAGEFLNIRLKDIQLLQNRALIVVDGKTGQRRIPICRSVTYLVQWLDTHPLRTNPDSLLWVSFNRQNLNVKLKHTGAQKIIYKSFKRAGLKKKCNFHWFRHSRATLLAPKISESILRKYMGWTEGSSQVERYVHLNVEQVENEIMRINGFVTKQSIEDKKPVNQICICGQINTEIAQFCFKCGNPLTIETAISSQELLNKATNERLKIFAEIMSDPVKKQQFEELRAMFIGVNGDKK